MALFPVRTELADTYPNPSNATFRTGIGKLWDAVTGLLGTDGNAATARTALGFDNILGKSGSITGRNRIINGAFAVNQRAKSGTVTLAAGAYGHDRWKAGASGCTYTFTRPAMTAIISITAGSLMQVIEGLNIEGGNYRLSHSGTANARTAVNGSTPTGTYNACPQTISTATGG
jgi:hypothetical protein